jgi:hypothetical protein
MAKFITPMATYITLMATIYALHGCFLPGFSLWRGWKFRLHNRKQSEELFLDRDQENPTM